MSKAKVFVAHGACTRHRSDSIYSSLKLWISYVVLSHFADEKTEAQSG